VSDIDDFKSRRRELIGTLERSADLQGRGVSLLGDACKAGYTYCFDWLGLPIIQVPQDIVATQELIWSVKPGAIVETGIARGGSLALSASMLHLLGGEGIVVGIDIDIRHENRAAIESHPLSKRIKLVEGSSTERSTFERARALVEGRKPVMVFLDSNHTEEHVLAELRLYAPLVGTGSYIVVFDTAIDQMPAGYYPDRPWGPGNNPRSAVHKFIRESGRFEIDRGCAGKLLLTCNPDGYLRCTKNP
jgi:cephalosporin hydroxylase